MQILNSETNADGIITTKDIDGKETKYSQIFAGLSFPTGSTPGAWCVCGEEYKPLPATKFEDAPKPGRGKIVLLAEGVAEGLSTDSLYSPLTDALALYSCRKVYCNTQSEDTVPFMEGLRSYIYKNSLQANLVDAPFVDNYTWGIAQVQDFEGDDMLTIPQGRTKEELGTIGRANLDDEPEKLYPALNAYRHCIAAFSKHHPRRRNPFRRPPQRGKWSR